MNVDTGELIRLRNGLTPEEAEMLGFTLVPKEHEAEANRIIKEAEADKQKAMADMTSDTPLVNWAKTQQKKPCKNKAKMAKTSRRRNRK
jgi:predicted nucleic acid-binding Zn ribbon protein